MATSNFLSDNELRAYPFPGDRAIELSRANGAPVELPPDVLVDFRSMLGLDAGWRASVDQIYLREIQYLPSGWLRFVFLATPAALSTVRLVFDALPTVPEFTPLRSNATHPVAGSQSSRAVEGDCHDPLLWSGVLTVGRLASLVPLLSPGETITAATGLLTVDPASIVDLGKTYARSINLANRSRFTVLPPAGCAGGDGGGEGYVVNAQCLRGDLVVHGGYGTVAAQEDSTKTITLLARQGAGLGFPCEDIPLAPGETPPAGSVFLSGGPSCDEVVTAINGVAGPVIHLVAGTGVRIAPSADHAATLVVAVDLHDVVPCSA